MAEVGQLRVRISLDNANFDRSIKDMNRGLKVLQTEIKASTSSGTGYARGVEEMRQKSTLLTRSLELQREKVEQLKRKYEENLATKGKDARETQNAAIAYNQARAEMARTENQLNGLNQAIRNQTNPWNNLSSNLQNVGSSLQNAGDRMKNIGTNLSMRVTAPIVGVGIAAVKTGMDFQAAMSQVQAVSGATGDDFKKLEAKARELGGSTMFSASQAAEGMNYLALAGWKTNDILAGMPGLLDLAAAGNLELGRAADITSDVMSAFGISAEKAGHAADVFAYAQANANTNVEMMGEAMTYLAPVANALGWELEESAAAIMKLADSGVKGSMAGQAFATSLGRLAKPTDAMTDEMKRLGMSFFDAQGNMKSLPQVMQQIEKGTKGMTKEQKSATLTTLFGAEAYKHWAILLESGSDSLAKTTNELKNADGAAAKMAKTMQNNAKGSLIELKSTLEELGIQIANYVIPSITKLTKAAIEWARKFGALPDENKKVILSIAGIAAAIGPLLVVGGVLLRSIGTVFTALGTVSGAIAVVTGGVTAATPAIGALATAFKFMTGPIGLTITGVTLLAGAFVALKSSKKENIDLSFESIEAQQKEIQSTDELIKRFDELNAKNQLSTDSMSRFLDIQTELSQTTSPEVIAKLERQQAHLLEKSGLTNEEMTEFISLNEELIKKAPETTQAITEQGNALALNSDKLKEINKEKLEMMKIEAENKLIQNLQQENEKLEDRKQTLKELNKYNKKREESLAEQTRLNSEINKNKMEIKSITGELNQTEYEQLFTLLKEQASLDEIKKITGEIGSEDRRRLEDLFLENDKLETKIGKQEKIFDKAVKEGNERRENLKTIDKDLKKIDESKWKYEQIILATSNLNAERGKGLETIQLEIAELMREKQRIDELHRANKINSDEYQTQISSIDTQIGKLKNTQGELNKINDIAGERIYKDVEFNKDLKKYGFELNEILGKTIFKSVLITGTKSGDRISEYAKGTSFHPGGLAIVGEEGPELVNLPRGAQVFTASETKRMVNNPSYMNQGEYNAPKTNQPVVLQVNLDKNVLAKTVYKDINELIENRNQRMNLLGGAQI